MWVKMHISPPQYFALNGTSTRATDTILAPSSPAAANQSLELHPTPPRPPLSHSLNEVI